MVRKVNIYKHNGSWAYSAWTEDGFDHSDSLDVEPAASEDEAREEARKQFSGATVERVENVA